MTEQPIVTIDGHGHKYWLNSHSSYHRTDGPAIEWINGDREWYINGKRHRTEGPAVEWSDSYKEWWVNGRRHREDGPAVEWEDGGKAWYINGKFIYREDPND